MFRPQPKPRPYALTKEERDAAIDQQDRRESAKVKRRAAGRCEVLERVLAVGGCVGHSHWTWRRCARPVAPGNHHLIGGSGRRNRGRSILAEHRLGVCALCHWAITQHVLVPCVSQAKAEVAATVRYERIR